MLVASETATLHAPVAPHSFWSTLAQQLPNPPKVLSAARLLTGQAEQSGMVRQGRRWLGRRTATWPFLSTLR